jgi:hypothetical protein
VGVVDFTDQFRRYEPDSFLPFIYSRSVLAGYMRKGWTNRDLIWPNGTEVSVDRNRALSMHVYECEPGTVQAINIDTGAANGGALSAVGLSPKWLASDLIPVLSVKADDNQREKYHKVSMRALYINF